MFPVYKKNQKVTLDKVCNKNAFISQLSSVDVPKNTQEALSVPKWKEAVFEEMKVKRRRIG